MIDYILQVEGQNILQVVYKSGYNRFVGIDAYGLYKLTKTQRDFMNNSIIKEYKTPDGWRHNITYWLNKDNPNPAIMSVCR